MGHLRVWSIILGPLILFFFIIYKYCPGPIDRVSCGSFSEFLIVRSAGVSIVVVIGIKWRHYRSLFLDSHNKMQEDNLTANTTAFSFPPCYSLTLLNTASYRYMSVVKVSPTYKNQGLSSKDDDLMGCIKVSYWQLRHKCINR